MNDLVLKNLDKARTALAEARSIPEVKEIRDKAAAIARFMRQQKHGRDAAIDADELAVRAERKLGNLLSEIVIPRGNHNRGHRGSKRSLPEGVEPRQSHRWQKVAAVKEEDFEAELAKAREDRKGITTMAMMRLAKKPEIEEVLSASRTRISCRFSRNGWMSFYK